MMQHELHFESNHEYQLQAIDAVWTCNCYSSLVTYQQGGIHNPKVGSSSLPPATNPFPNFHSLTNGSVIRIAARAIFATNRFMVVFSI